MTPWIFDSSTIDDRLKALFELKKKYGPTLGDVIAFKEAQKVALKLCQSQEISEDELAEKLAEKEAEVTLLAKELTEKRKKDQSNKNRIKRSKNRL